VPVSQVFDGRILTETTVGRLRALLPAVPSKHAGGAPVDGFHQVVHPLLGGTLADISVALEVLLALRMVQESTGRYVRTADGDRLVKVMRAGAHHEFELALLRSGLLAAQVRDLLPVLVVTEAGYHCSAASARRVAPQLVGVLAALPGVRVRGRLELDLAVSAELESPLCQQLVPPMAQPGSAEERQQVGDRAELYSLSLEHSAYLGASRDVLWVSRDDYSAGYDIEAGPSDARRYVEVKGSRGREITFILSSGEWDAANRLGAAYEIHFWGDIRLNSDPRDEYVRLREAGYPQRVVEPAAALLSEDWEMAPVGYRVRLRPPRPTQLP
jgi:hypothetical protein